MLSYDVYTVLYERGLLIASASILLLLLALIVYPRTLHPLSGVPGPFLASVTRFWYVWRLQYGSFDAEARELHRRYGSLVRIAPDEVSISDPEAVKTIYGINSGFTKTDFYLPWQVNYFDTIYKTNFSETDEARHASRRKLVNSIYSLSSVLESETHIDTVTHLFVEKLDRFAMTGEKVNLGQWLQMYAFDVIGELYFGRYIGFIETEGDYGDYIKSLDVLLPAQCTASILPVRLRIPFLVCGSLFPSIRDAVPCMVHIGAAAKEHVGKREALLAEKGRSERRDFMSKLFDLHFSRGAQVDFKVADIQQEAFTAIFAGSDTTAIALRSILHNILCNLKAYRKLLAELTQANQDGRLNSPIRYSQAIKLPYLSACVKEGMRIHPSIGLHLPRYVPKGGREIAGYHFPEGWRVGINAAVLHYNTDIFGPDAAEFNPERWFERDSVLMDVSQAKKHVFGIAKVHEQRYMFHFGAGSRSCIGKNISLAEVHKLIPELLLKYDIELVRPSEPLKNHDFWFNKQTGFDVRVSKRGI